MKKLIKIFTVCSILFLIAGCASKDSTSQTPADSYTPEITKISAPSETEEGQEETAGQGTSTPSTTKTSSGSGKSTLQDLLTFGNKGDYIKYDETPLFTKEIVGIKEKKAVMVIRTDNQMAGWGSSYLAGYNYIQFDKKAREALFNAIDIYFSDFDNKNLKPKGKNTDKAYGRLYYRLDWGTISSSTPNYAHGYGYMGYEFVKGSPYFCISNYPFKNEYEHLTQESPQQESMRIIYYFTRSQLKQLKAVLSEDTINDELEDFYGAMLPTTDADVY